MSTEPAADSDGHRESATERHNRRRPVVIGIDGRSSSGKTTLATRLGDLLGAPVVHTDDFAWERADLVVPGGD